MEDFKRQLGKLNRENPDEEVKGWHRIIRMAKKMADEDMEYAINCTSSADLIQNIASRTYL